MVNEINDDINQLYPFPIRYSELLHLRPIQLLPRIGKIGEDAPPPVAQAMP